jgi:hypothetical protein
MLSVDDAPRNLTLVAFNHSGVCPSAILRHWNFARSDFFKHGSKISAFVTAECSGDILPNEITWVSPPRGRSYSPNNVNCCAEQSTSYTIQPLSFSCYTQILTRTSCTDDIHGFDLVRINPCNIPELLHIGEMPRGHRAWKRFNLRCPKRRNTCMACREKPSANPVKQTAERHCLSIPSK